MPKSAVVKGLGRVFFPDGMGDDAIAAAMPRVSNQLQMDYATRMARAKEGKFGDDTFYHATGGDIEAFDNARIGQSTDEGWFGRGHYFAPDPNYSNQFVPTTGNANTVPVKLRANNQYDWRANEVDSGGRGMATASDDARQFKTDELINAGYSGVDVYDDVIKLPEGESLSQDQWQKVKDHYTEKMGSFPQWLKKETVEDTLRRGASKHAYVEQYGEDFVSALPQERVLKERMVFDPKNIRSVNAAFDPAKRESSNLLASAVPAAVGLGALYTPEQNKAYADTLKSKGLAHLIPSGDKIEPDEFPKLEQVATFLDKYGQTPFGPAFEGVSAYLRGFGDDADAKEKAKRALGAALDLM